MFVVIDRFDQRTGNAPLDEQRGGQFVVVGLQVFLFECRHVFSGIRVLQQAAGGHRIHRGE